MPACRGISPMNRCLPLVLAFAFLILLSPTASADENQATPLFSRHVTAVFSKLGCNGGTCHGAVKGQNGFRLSLFAADPAADHDRLIHEIGGRRLNFQDPDASLILQKATAQVGHEGGKRTDVGSSDYQILRRWIAAGAPLDALDKSRVAQLKITPAEQTIKPAEKYRLKVEVKFADGSTEDVTALCSYDSLDKAVAGVGSNGEVETRGVGDTALIVRYRAEPAMALVMVPRPGNEAFPDVKPQNFIDEHILAKLKRLNIPPADLADEATFLRRVTLDVTGELPTAKEVRDFLADKSADKRAKKIDELLQRPGYAALWAMKFCDLLKASDFGVYADGVTEQADAPRFQQWIRARLQENVPYDEFVRRILTATSREGRTLEEWAEEVREMQEGYAPGRPDLAIYANRKTLDLYWQRKGAGGVIGALQVAHTFLGLRLECAQCHRHPHDVWQQDDLLSFANFFTRVRGSGFQGGNEKRAPDVAEYTKKLNEEAKKLGDEAKKMREAAPNKKLEGEDAKMVAEMERKSKMLPEIGRRMMHSEIHHLTDGTTAASVTSPLGTQKSERFRLLGRAEALDVAKDQDPRTLVAEWMCRPENPYLAKAIVNRVWAHYFGRGIIDPPDNLSSFNPASHPELLKELCDQFVKNHYDLKWLHKMILRSRTYQHDSQASAANRVDHTNYAYFYYRRLPAEVLVDALDQATGTRENMDMKFQHWADNIKAVEIPFTPKNEFVKFMLENFGRPKRNSAVQCDCERDPNVSILQVMSLANHPHVWKKIADPKGQVARILKEVQDENGRIEEVFLCTLSRSPNEGEQQACLKYLKEADSAEKGLQGIMWSLVNTREFLLQH
jgi:hypothetical protein